MDALVFFEVDELGGGFYCLKTSGGDCLWGTDDGEDGAVMVWVTGTVGESGERSLFNSFGYLVDDCLIFAFAEVGDGFDDLLYHGGIIAIGAGDG